MATISSSNIDLAYTSHYLENIFSVGGKPTASLTKSIKHMLGCLNSTCRSGLPYNTNTRYKADEILKFYSDADFVENNVDRVWRCFWLIKFYRITFPFSVEQSTPEFCFTLNPGRRTRSFVRSYL